MRKIRTFRKEYKTQICEMILKESINPKIIAEKIGIQKTMIYRWISEYKDLGEDAFVGHGNQRKEDAKYRKLLKENEKLKQECEILKKAAAYLAKEKAKG